MKRAHFLTIAVFVIVAGWSGLLHGGSKSMEEEIVIHPDVKLKKLTQGVWRHITYMEMEKYGRVPANGLLVIDGKKAVMIDTPWTGEQTTLLIDWLEKNKKVRLESVIPTHWHVDCMGGLELAHKRGAKSYALDKTIERAKKEKLPVPGNGFKDKFTLKCGATALELFYPGGGHTIDNIVVWLPEKQILFGGCAVKTSNSKTLGNLNDAVLKEWPGTVNALLKRYPNARWVVPGHGKPGGMDYLKHTMKLLNSLSEVKQ